MKGTIGSRVIRVAVITGVILALVAAAACSPSSTTPTPPPGPSPTNSSAATLRIVSPANGASLPPGNITVTTQVTNFNVVDRQGQANVSGEGHLHFYMDVDAPTTPGQPAVPTSGVWAHVGATTYTFTSVEPGTHTISVQLINNDHTPLIPITFVKITISVTSASPPASTPTPTTTPASTPTPTPTAITPSPYPY